MLNEKFRKRLLSAVLLGVLTVLFCLVLADGIIGMNAWESYRRDALILPGGIVFFVSIVGLPILFSRWTSPLYTLVNIPVIYVLFFPVEALFDNVDLYRDPDLMLFFLLDGSFDFMPDWLDALLVAVVFFVIEFIVMAAACLVRFVWRKACNGNQRG